MDEKKEIETKPVVRGKYEVIVLGHYNVGKSTFLANIYRTVGSDWEGQGSSTFGPEHADQPSHGPYITLPAHGREIRIRFTEWKGKALLEQDAKGFDALAVVLNPAYKSSVKQFPRFLVVDKPEYWGNVHKAIFVRICNPDETSIFGEEERAIAKMSSHYFRENIDLRKYDFSDYLEQLSHNLVENDVQLTKKAKMALRSKLARILGSSSEGKLLPIDLWVTVLGFIHVADYLYDNERESVGPIGRCLVM